MLQGEIKPDPGPGKRSQQKKTCDPPVSCHALPPDPEALGFRQRAWTQQVQSPQE
jgi:hypothetical protein